MAAKPPAESKVVAPVRVSDLRWMFNRGIDAAVQAMTIMVRRQSESFDQATATKLIRIATAAKMTHEEWHRMMSAPDPRSSTPAPKPTEPQKEPTT